jgi:hypothetical protein
VDAETDRRFPPGSNFVYMLVKKCEENPEYEAFIKVRCRGTREIEIPRGICSK